MKKLITLFLSISIFISLVAFTNDKGLTQNQNDEKQKSQIVWTGSKLSGSMHTGTIKVKDNMLEIVDGEVKGGSITIDMTTIINTDLEGKWNEKLVNHLKDADFFDVEKYPLSTIKIKSVKEGEYRHKYIAVADITIRDITLEKEFEFEKVEIEGGYKFRATIDIDRTKFGVKYKSGNFFKDLGDKAIDDMFSLNVLLSYEGVGE